MDIIVEELVVENDREAHISKHKITLKEVQEIIENEYVFIEGRYGRWILIGPTKKQRMLAVVVGSRRKKNVYGFVTARPARKKESEFYRIVKLKSGGDKK